jgi:hypothetical protein
MLVAISELTYPYLLARKFLSTAAGIATVDC